MLYKIRNKETGLFSLGGRCPQFSKNGKAFLSLRALRLHYNVINTYGGYLKVDRIKETYKGCEVVEYSIVEKQIHKIGEEVNE